MAVKRKLPFGYEMCLGKITLKEQEAEVVQSIFTAYANGASYSQLTQRLNTQAVPYNGQGKVWNKNMVARILGNQIYVGVSPYPAIISEDEWRRANAARPATGSLTAEGRLGKAIRQISICAECGSRLILSANSHAWERWNCPSCGALTAQATTPNIKTGLTQIMAAIYESPELIQAPEPPTEQRAIAQKVSEFEKMLSTPDFDETEAANMALALAAARFDSLDNRDYETQRIQHILADAKPCEELDVDVLRQITAAVLIHPSGRVSLKLRNGQIIRGSDTI